VSDHPAEHRSNPDASLEVVYFRFDDPHPNQSFFDAMYEVSGRTRVEKHLITIAREEFVSLLLKDEKVISRLQTWISTIDLPAIANDVADFLDRVAHRCGLPHRRALNRAPHPLQTLVEDLLPEYHRLEDRLRTAYECCPEVVRAARVYVHEELGQPCLWLALRLTQHVFETEWERAIGIRRVSRRPSELDDNIHEPPVQSYRSVFETRPGETLPEAKQRRMAEALEDCGNMQPEPAWPEIYIPKGVLRKNQEDITKRNTRWLYQHLICRESKYRIAQSYHNQRQDQDEHRKNKDFPKCSCQVDVGQGINKAEQLLLTKK
jgi:hypothetical protein